MSWLKLLLQTGMLPEMRLPITRMFLQYLQTYLTDN